MIHYRKQYNNQKKILQEIGKNEHKRKQNQMYVWINLQTQLEFRVGRVKKSEKAVKWEDMEEYWNWEEIKEKM